MIRSNAKLNSMKQLQSIHSTRGKKVACTVSAAALMLGVSSAATIGLHFQENYCGAPAYSGYPVTLTAFGIAPSGWENLLPMDTGYNGCAGPLSYMFTELIDSTTSTNGLNPLPNGSLTVTWSGPTANFDPFAGYAGAPPYYYTPGGPLPTNAATGEEQIYATFIRDGINFGPGSSGGDNDQPGYLIDVTGLKSLFTNSPFVVELMASGDSIETLTNAYITDVTTSTLNIVSYPNIPPVDRTESSSYYQGTGGGLSTASAPLNTDHIQIKSAPPEHELFPGPNHAGTISGFIITDKPVITMSPQPVPLAGPGDTIQLSAYAIGVPPLSYQWQLNGESLVGATTSAYTISNFFNPGTLSFSLQVSNAYGIATSAVSTVTGDSILLSKTNNIVFDSSSSNAQNNGFNIGSTWLASSTGSNGVTRTGVESFSVEATNGISVADDTNFDGSTGTITLWMKSPGTDSSEGGLYGGSLFCRATGTPLNDFILLQADSGQALFYGTQASGTSVQSTSTVSDGNWHFVALTFDQAASGGVGLFVDGTLQATNGNSSAWSWPAGAPLEIGYTTDTSFENYSGQLDDVRYYSAVLTPSQIAQVYTTGAAVDPAALEFDFNFNTAPGAGTVLTWKISSAVLQSAPALNGPWTDLPGVTSPYTIVPSQSQQFFRYRYVPQTRISNPYLM